MPGACVPRYLRWRAGSPPAGPDQRNPAKGPHDISFRARLQPLSIALLTIAALLFAAGGAQAASPDQYPVLMKRLATIAPGTTVHASAAKLFPDDAADANGFRTMAGRVDAGPIAKFTAAIAYCAAGRAGPTGVQQVAVLAGQGKRPAAERSVSAAVGSCIDTAVPPMQRLQAKSVQGALVDAVLWVELKMRPDSRIRLASWRP
ncbi:hypothetical protein [Arthrobacter sp.]|uniref:hypothetical protein n=1 Tax=Arthrobacter sp. TaxID=1667 RepID=UPI003A911F3B